MAPRRNKPSDIESRAMETRGVDDPARKAQLKKKNPLNWHVQSPDRGPAPLALKNHFIAMIGEYVGTVLFMIFALGGTNVANIPTTSVTGATTSGQSGSTASTANTSNLLYIALSFGFSLAVNAWIFFRVSGGLFNPAVSLGMVLVGALTPLRGALLTLSQILGGITGAAIIQAILPGTLNVRTQLGGGTSIVQGLFLEMFLTSLLMLAILLLAAEKHKATFIAPIGIGLALFVAELLGVYYTGGSLNPARSFGPDVVLKSFNGYHWIYWVGPGLGAIIAAGFYKMLKWLQYETVLGPETDGPETGTESAEPGQAKKDDTQNDVEKSSNSRKLDVSGPGIGDLHTTGDRTAVFDLEQNPGPMEVRLMRMEAMLNRLVEMPQQNQGSGTTLVYSPVQSGSTGTLGKPSGSTGTLGKPLVDGPADVGRRSADARSPASDVGRRSADVGRRSVEVRSPTSDVGRRSARARSPVSDAGRRSMGGRSSASALEHQHAPFTHGVAGAGRRAHVDV